MRDKVVYKDGGVTPVGPSNHPPHPGSLPSCQSSTTSLGCSSLGTDGDSFARRLPSPPLQCIHTPCQNPLSPPGPPISPWETPPPKPPLPGGWFAWVAGNKGLRSEVPLCSQHLAGEGARRGWSGVSPSLQQGSEEQAEEQAEGRSGGGSR